MNRYIFVSIVFIFLIFFVNPLPVTALSLVNNGQRSEQNVGDFGINIASGDVNGDSYQDLIIADDMYSSNRGALFIYFGSSNGIHTTPDVLILGEEINNYIAQTSNLAVQDVNADGFADILFGSFANSQGPGKAYLLYGKTNLSSTILASSVDVTGIGNATDRFRFGIMTNFGDYNGDGKKDIIIGAFTNNFTTTSNYFIFINNNNTFNFSSPTFTVNTSATYLPIYGLSINDYNNDNYSDMVIADIYNANGHGLFLFLGSASGNLTQTALFTPEVKAVDIFGRSNSISSADINHDGYPDFCIGGYQNSTLASKQGRVYCWYGRSSFTSTYPAANADIILNGFAAEDNFGRTVEMSDIDNDGNPDLLVGAYQTSNTAGSRHGKFFIYHGNGTGFDTTPWYSDVKTSGNTAFGNIVHAYDGDNDGFKDIAVMQGGTASGGTGAPAVNLFEISHGSPSITNIAGSGYQNQKSIIGKAQDTTSGYDIRKVQWSTNNSSYGIWKDCNASDGEFNSNSEEFSCDLTSLTDSRYSIYLRTKDQNDVYLPASLYSQVSVTLDTVSPVYSYTNKEGTYRDFKQIDLKNYATINVHTPAFKFSQSQDSLSEIDKYQIFIFKKFNDNTWDWSVYIDDISPDNTDNTHNGTKKRILDDKDRYTEYFEDEIFIHLKSDNNNDTNIHLPSGAYKWKVRAIDKANNYTDTESRIFMINTHEANFSNTFNPLTILTIGNKTVNLTSLDPNSYRNYILNNLELNSQDTITGIAASQSTVTLTLSNSNTITPIKLTAQADNSRFTLPIPNTLPKGTYTVSFSLTNTSGDYVEVGEVKIKIN